MMQALALSGGKDSMACLHLLRDTLSCAIYVDTGYGYPETKALVEYAATIIPVHIVTSDRDRQQAQSGWPSDVVPIAWTHLGQSVTTTKDIMIQSYLGCCFENISFPLLERARELGVTHLVYGKRREETTTSIARNGDCVHGMIRVHPIEDWTASQVLAYLDTKMAVPEHYRTVTHSSLDCYDCTGFRQDSQDRAVWMQQHYPHYYDLYRERMEKIDAAIQAGLHVTTTQGVHPCST